MSIRPMEVSAVYVHSLNTLVLAIQVKPCDFDELSGVYYVVSSTAK
jgi:hypothetical protein